MGLSTKRMVLAHLFAPKISAEFATFTTRRNLMLRPSSARWPSSMCHVPFSTQPFMVWPLSQHTHTMSLITAQCFSPAHSQLSSWAIGGFLASCHDIWRTKSTTIWLASCRAVDEAAGFLKGHSMYLRLSLSQCNVMGLPHLQGMVISKSSMLVWPLACSPQHPHSNS